MKRNTGSGEGAVTRRRSSGECEGAQRGVGCSGSGSGPPMRAVPAWAAAPGAGQAGVATPACLQHAAAPCARPTLPPACCLPAAPLVPAAAAARGKGSSYFYTDDSAAIKLSPVRKLRPPQLCADVS